MWNGYTLAEARVRRRRSAAERAVREGVPAALVRVRAARRRDARHLALWCARVAAPARHMRTHLFVRLAAHSSPPNGTPADAASVPSAGGAAASAAAATETSAQLAYRRPPCAHEIVAAVLVLRFLVYACYASRARVSKKVSFSVARFAADELSVDGVLALRLLADDVLRRLRERRERRAETTCKPSAPPDEEHERNLL